MPLLGTDHQLKSILSSAGSLIEHKKLMDRRNKERDGNLCASLHHRSTYNYAVSRAKSWQIASSKMAGEQLMSIDENLSGNHQIYTAMGMLLESIKPDSFSDPIKTMRYFSHIAELRGIPGLPENTNFKLESRNPITLALHLTAVSDSLKRAYSSAQRDLENRIAEKIGGGAPDPRPAVIKSTTLTLFSWGNLITISNGKNGSILSVDHFNRLCESILQLRNYVLLIVNSIKATYGEVVSVLQRLFKIALSDPDGFGEGAKAARNLLVWKLSNDRPFDASSEDMLRETYSDWKVLIAEKITEALSSLEGSVASKIQLSYLFKYIPHPDVDIVACYESTLGVRDANDIVEAALPHFEGVLRRSLYSASVKNGEPFRFESGPEIFMLESELPSPNYRKLCELEPLLWAKTKFKKSLEFENYLDIDLKVKDKSHSDQNAKLDLGSNYQLAKDFLIGKSKLDVPTASLFKSDLADKYKDQSTPTSLQSREYFRRIQDAHIRKEVQLGRPMTSSELADFFKEEPEAFHLVATEGKYGETHKKVTRMFYLANPYIKTYMSLAERLFKKISKGQLGNSIVKSFDNKEKDLREFAHSCKGSEVNFAPWYLSFDMSEFSKKFPGADLRVLGKIAAELTGDDLLRRIDIVFRSSVVAHRTRGISASFAGVTGGFEGFCNFGWTTIHVAIMNYGLIRAGVSGVTLAYSDDGVLFFMVKGRESEHLEKVRQAVISIRETYRDLGLVFHIGKMLLSRTTFEYLGEISDDGRFLPMYPKSLATFGVTEEDKSLNTFGSTIDAYIGQVTAAVKDGYEVSLIEPFLYYQVYLKLTRIFEHLKPDDAVGLMILPKSCGGFGVPCGLNMSLTASRDQLSELIADVTLIARSYPRLSRKIIGFCISNMKEPGECAPSMVSGRSLCIRSKDTSGISVLLEAGNKLRHKIGLEDMEHPVTDRVVTDIITVLKLTSGMLPSTVSSLVEASPKMIEYTNVLSEGRSIGAARLLDKSVLRDLQARDTKNVKGAIDQYVSSRPGDYGPSDLYEIAASRLRFNGFDVPGVSLRLRIEVNSVKRDVVIISDLQCSDEVGLGRVSAKDIASLSYLEPLRSTTDHQDRLIFESEHTSDNSIPYQLLKVASIVVARNPGLGEHVRAICNSLGVTLPSFLQITGAALSRTRSLRNVPDLIMNVPSVIVARSVVILGSRVLEEYNKDETGDRTTLEYTSQVINAMYYGRDGYLRESPKSSRTIVSLRVLGSGFPVKSPVVEPLGVPPERLRAIRPMGESEALLRAAANEAMMRTAKIDTIDIASCTDGELNLLKDYLTDQPYRSITKYLGSGLVEKGMRPILKTTSNTIYNIKIVKHLALRILHWGLVSFPRTPSYRIMYSDRADGFSTSKERLIRGLECYEELLPVNLIYEIAELPEEEVTVYQSLYNAVDSLFDSKAVLVVDNNNRHGSDPVVARIRSLIRATIDETYAKCDKQWNLKRRYELAEDTQSFVLVDAGNDWVMARESGSEAGTWSRGLKLPPLRHPTGMLLEHDDLRDADIMLDGLAALADSLRRSPHREDTFNHTTLQIMIYKIVCAVSGFSEVSVDEYIGQRERDDDLAEIGSESEYGGGVDDEAHDRDARPYYTATLKPDASNYFRQVFLMNKTLGPLTFSDHQKILDNPLSPLSRNRFSVYARFPAIPRKMKCSTLDECYRLSQRMTVHFSSLINLVINKKVKVLDRITLAGVETAPCISRLPSLNSDGESMVGYCWGRDMMDTSMLGSEIMYANLALGMHSEGISALTLTADTPVSITNSLPRDIPLDAHRGVDLCYRTFGRDIMVLINEGYSTAAEALSAYVSFQGCGRAYLSVFTDSDYTIVSGVILADARVEINMSPDPYFIDDERAQLLVSCDTQYLSNVLKAQSGIYIARRALSQPKQPLYLDEGKVIQSLYSGDQVVSDKLEVCYAAILSKTDRVAESLYAYFMLRNYLMGKPPSEARVDYLNEINELKEITDQRAVSRAIKGLCGDAALIKGYFSRCPVRYSGHLPDDESLYTAPRFARGNPKFLRSKILYGSFSIHGYCRSIEKLEEVRGKMREGDDLMSILFDPEFKVRKAIEAGGESRMNDDMGSDSGDEAYEEAAAHEDYEILDLTNEEASEIVRSDDYFSDV